MADVFWLTKPILSIKLNPHGHGVLSNLPADAKLRFLGPSGAPGFVEVIYRDKLYRVFMVDLIERSISLRVAA